MPHGIYAKPIFWHASSMLQDGQMEDLHALQQQQYEGYLQSPEQAS